MRKILKYCLIILQSILIFISVGAILTASVKNIQKIVLVEKFKKQGVFQEEKSTAKEKLYKIASSEEIPTYQLDGNKIIPGAPGDILVSTQATLIHPIISNFVSFFAGGHAAICTEYYEDFDIYTTNKDSIEATGLDEGENNSKIFEIEDSWVYNNYFDEIIGLRVKMTESERKEVLSTATSLIGDPYNYSFIFDTTNKSYCSDIVSKAFKKIGKNLNKDDFTTSVYDLIVNNEVYIIYYHYFDSDGIKHIYYLG